jgi:hypothetical protein
MPQESLLALGAIVTIVIAAVAMLEGSTTAERDDGDRLVDSVRGLLEETGALAAARAVSGLLANRPVRQARRPRSSPGRAAAPGRAEPSMSAASAIPPVAATPGVPGVDDVPTEVWSQAAMSDSSARPATQPNRIIVSSVRSGGRSLRRGPVDEPIPAPRPRVTTTRRRRSMSLPRIGLLHILTAILFVALIVLVAILLFRPQGEAGVLGETSSPSYATAILPTTTPSATLESGSPGPSRTPGPTPAPTPAPAATAAPTATATATPRRTTQPQATTKTATPSATATPVPSQPTRAPSAAPSAT